MRRSNGISRTVKNYIPAKGVRFNRNKRNLKQSSDDEKSNFVRFFESLENRGPLEIHGLYKKWTRKVRKKMEEAGTWPKEYDEFKPEVVAEYISRLQKAFWQEFPWLKWYTFDLESILTNRDKLNRFRPKILMLEVIYNKIRLKGIRDRTYKLSNWDWRVTPWYSHIDPGPRFWANKWEPIRIKPYTPWNNEGWGI